jgi:hypothetical protein
MRMHPTITPRAVAAHIAIAIVAASATVAGVAFADDSAATPVSSKPAQSRAATVAAAPASDPIAVAARGALDRLVADGTIDRSQAATIEQQVEGGSVDPTALVNAQVVDQAQMQAVAGALDHVKRAAGY